MEIGFQDLIIRARETTLNKLYNLHAVPTRRGGSRYKLPGRGGQEKGTRLDYVAYVFVFLGTIIVCSTVLINPFRPSPSHSATEKSVFPTVCKYFSPVHPY